MEWKNLGIRTLEHGHIPQMFFKIPGKSNKYRFYLPSSLKFCDNISYKLLWPSQFLEKFMEILEWSTLQKKIRPPSLLNAAAYWKSSNTEACANNLSQILANNIDNGGREIDFRIYVTYCGFWISIWLGLMMVERQKCKVSIKYSFIDGWKFTAYFGLCPAKAYVMLFAI